MSTVLQYQVFTFLRYGKRQTGERAKVWRGVKDQTDPADSSCEKNLNRCNRKNKIRPHNMFLNWVKNRSLVLAKVPVYQPFPYNLWLRRAVSVFSKEGITIVLRG